MSISSRASRAARAKRSAPFARGSLATEDPGPFGLPVRDVTAEPRGRLRRQVREERPGLMERAFLAEPVDQREHADAWRSDGTDAAEDDRRHPVLVGRSEDTGRDLPV